MCAAVDATISSVGSRCAVNAHAIQSVAQMLSVMR